MRVAADFGAEATHSAPLRLAWVSLPAALCTPFPGHKKGNGIPPPCTTVAVPDGGSPLDMRCVT